MTIDISGLVAYPFEPRDISTSIRTGVEEIKQNPKFRNLMSWEEGDIPGKFISTEVLSNIDKGNILIADITRFNFNVIYEIGYAIGAKKRIFLTRNKAIRPNPDLIRKVGIFDTLGYKEYSGSSEFVELISSITDLSPIRFNSELLNNRTPVYLILPPIKNDVQTHLISRIKKARLFYRSFDPAEHGRLSAPDAIENVASSHGVILTLLRDDYADSEIHNYRAAFVAGLAEGMKKPLLLIQNENEPVPLDYRDLVRSFTYPLQIDQFIADFGMTITESLQSANLAATQQPSNILARLSLGASSAENEFQELGQYYLETDEFRRTLRGEVQVVLGRKGAGKSALFFQVRDRLRNDKKNVVLDLKPEGFQLVKFKERVLDFLEEGTREHTVTAFWEYIILLEICHKLLLSDKKLHLHNHNLYEPYQKLSSMYETDEYIAEGDFSERMLRLTQTIADDFTERPFDTLTSKVRFTTDEVTAFVYKHNIKSLQSELVTYLKNKQSLWILFDNLDKGWPPYGINADDVLSLRCLLDAMIKLERFFRREGIPTTGIIFIRNDVYENLIASTSDRGKTSHILVDWTDPALLLELLRRRLISSEIQGDPSFNTIWHQICVSHLPNGDETSYYMVDRCLMRPRSLIDLFRFCRSHAVNIGHERIEVEDIENGEEQYSTQLVNDISFEIRDIFSSAEDILYEFIESPHEINKSKMDELLNRVSTDIEMKAKILELLLWYGFIGFRRISGDPTYIYSVHYDMKRLKALLKKHEEEGVIFTINPAFWKGLEIKS